MIDRCFMKKRILIFSLCYYPTFVSGAEVAIKEITDRISEEEIEFHLITLRFDRTLPKVEKIGHVFIHRIGFVQSKPSFQALSQFPLRFNKLLFQFLASWKAIWLHKEYQYEAIWAVMAHSAGVPAALFKWMFPTIPFILTLQEGDPPEKIERIMRPLWPLFSRAFTTADIVQPISRFLGEWARRRGFQGPIEVIHNGANPKDVIGTISSEQQARVNQVIQKKEGEIILINTARLAYQKGNDVTIQALTLLPPFVRLVLVGDGVEENFLRDLAKNLGVEKRVLFVGHVDRENVTAYRKMADIFVGPSRSEGLGLAFLSAMASHLPVITTQEGGIAEFAFDKKRDPDQPTTAWIVDKDQPEQIVAAVKQILMDPLEVRRVTEQARALVLTSYEWSQIAQDMREKVFKRVFEKKKTL